MPKGCAGSPDMGKPLQIAVDDVTGTTGDASTPWPRRLRRKKRRSFIIRNWGAMFRQPENDAVNGLAEQGLIRNVQTSLCGKFVR
jgi:hypothetical protein